MTALNITAITNFILASELFLLTGMLIAVEKSPRSAAWYWTWSFLLLGLGALLGGIDHGFVEPLGQAARYPLQRASWVMLGVTTFCVLLTTSQQFFPARLHSLVFIIGVIQLVAFAVGVFAVGRFWVVVVNYAPVMLLLLACSIRGLGDGTGSWWMIAGIVILFVASILQMLGVDTFSPLDRDGLYHVVSMVGVPFLYLGGLQLAVTV